MSDTEIAHGPIDYLIVEWPAGTQPNGEGLKELANLTDRGLIRVLDLVFVTKGEDGAVAGLALADIDGDGDLDLMEFEGAASGLIGPDDYDDAGGGSRPARAAEAARGAESAGRPHGRRVRGAEGQGPRRRLTSPDSGDRPGREANAIAAGRPARQAQRRQRA